MIALARQCARFKELLFALMGRELSARYRGSMLGKLWMVLQPLAFLGIYYVVFSNLFATKMAGDFLPATFALAMFCGLIPWIAFSETLARGTTCVLENGNLIKKFAFPCEILPVHLTVVSLVNACVGFLMLALGVFLLLEGQLPRWDLIWLFPIALVLQAIFTLGLVYLLGSITVYVRDVSQIMPMVITFWFFMSPIFMFAKNPGTPELMQSVLRWNPVTYLIAIYREIFIWDPERMKKVAAHTEANNASIALPFTEPGDVPWFEVGVFAACAFAMLFIGLRVFQKLKPGFSDEI
ncbi:MAG: hypothetical protein CMJ83_02115 [Planctomycetes bacterium]|nr:hypothetical protein [Planctomycetota bacterium]